MRFHAFEGRPLVNFSFLVFSVYPGGGGGQADADYYIQGGVVGFDCRAAAGCGEFLIAVN